MHQSRLCAPFEWEGVQWSDNIHQQINAKKYCQWIPKESNKRAAGYRKKTRKEVRNSSCFACNSLAAFCWKTLLGARSGADEYIPIFWNSFPILIIMNHPKLMNINVIPIPFRANILTGGSRFEKVHSQEMRAPNYILVFRSPPQLFQNSCGGDLNTKM